MSEPTVSELPFEEWCREQGLVFRRIKQARGRRPDYAVKVSDRWCVVEVKEIDPDPADNALAQELLLGLSGAHWVEPGARLTGPIRKGSRQLKKFSERGLPTVVCFFDVTVGFYTEGYHVERAMFGREVLLFDASGTKGIQDSFLGTKSGGGATITSGHNTSVSAIAVLHRMIGSKLVIDLYHNPFARVPIPREMAAPYVREQRPPTADDPRHSEPTVLDLMATPEWQEWIDDPDGKCDREVQKILAELREKGS